MCSCVHRLFYWNILSIIKSHRLTLMLCKVLKTVQLLLHVLRNFFNGAATLPLGNGVNKSTLIRNGSHKKPLMLCKSKIVVYLFTPFDMNSFDSFINWIYCIAEGGGIFSLKSSFDVSVCLIFGFWDCFLFSQAEANFEKRCKWWASPVKRASDHPHVFPMSVFLFTFYR